MPIANETQIKIMHLQEEDKKGANFAHISYIE